ncbi:MAG: tetratricopeptide repeat protein [Gammaproteobacteria bacterium]|uniref:Tetratricopeptide repeat protein n=1 Tax=Marinobacter litoralis TaxID=187981 RepID=A0A3M2RLU0_9GAMM|nr:tetratricopeptide repeat protein [Marinobacter litoralis]MBR9871288.1 tetratricopeptide repeat protein [Gammaproteobacteria bacterium]RMJ06169.1 Tetratricopeptide repeat protein [Marinobacter litoralis]
MFNGTRETGLCLLLSAVTLISGCAATSNGPGSETAQLNPVYSPERASVLALEGKQAYDRGDVETAIQTWQSAVELNPADAVTVNNLALVLKDENRFSEAANLLEKGVGASPETAELHYNLAVISELYLLQLDKALVHYKRYQQLSGTEDKSVAGWIADLERRLQ